MTDKLYELMDWPAIEGIVYSEEDRPDKLLGAHVVKSGILVQYFMPGAVSVTLVKKKPVKRYEMELADEAGFFAVLVPGKRVFEYEFEVTMEDGRTFVREDTYAYGTTIAEEDIKAFNAGVNYEVYNMLGAHRCEVRSVSGNTTFGTRFAVWAPNALRVSIVGDFNDWDGRVYQMVRRNGGVFELFIPEDLSGQCYKYEIKNKAGIAFLKADPYAFESELRPDTASGCGDIKIDEENKVFELGGYTFHEGDYISLDGSTGKIYKGDIATVEAEISGYFGRIMDWADSYRKLGVRTNADTPADTKKAVELGAQGIGLCRTEHMFFGEDRIPKFRRMILSDTVEQREEALKAIGEFQKADFKAMYEALEGRPMTVRYLDPPLHEFVPTEEEDIKALALDMGLSAEEVKAKCDALHEFNPMMGHRGCRLAVTYPEIARMQTRAVIEAAIEVSCEKGYEIVPEIMIPLVGEVKELKYVKDVVVETAEKVKKEKNSDITYHIGTMIEIPRAALTAAQIAQEADFFSFGTNDLTQMTFGFSRDDAGKFLDSYYQAKIYESDPFARLDQTGVGQLVLMAVKNGRETRPDLKCGICGEHGGDPSSIEFCHKAGLDYVSCSPFRVPIARLAAAQAAIMDGRIK